MLSYDSQKTIEGEVNLAQKIGMSLMSLAAASRDRTSRD